MLKIKDIKVSIAEFSLIKNFSFTSDRSKIVVIGDEASGKTTLLKILARGLTHGHRMSMQGNIKIGSYDFDIRERSEKVPDEYRIAYLPQEASNFFLGHTVKDEILLTALCSSTVKEELDQKLQKWEENTLLDKTLFTISPLSLSGGQQRLLMFEAVLLSNPYCIIADGGFSGMDNRFMQHTINLINEWIYQNREHTFIRSETSVETACEGEGILNLSDAKNRLEYTHVLANDKHDSYPTSTEKETLIEYRSVSAAYKNSVKKSLFKNISLKIYKSEIVGLAGKNGVGKSTLMQLLSGTRDLISGEIFFDGISLSSGEWAGLKGGIAYIPQEPELAGPRSKKIQLEAPQDLINIIEKVKLQWDGKAESYWNLSSSQKMLASMCTQAAYNPKLWLIDEPTTRLPPDKVGHILEHILKPASTFVISHDMDFLNKYCDRIISLQQNGITYIK